MTPCPRAGWWFGGCRFEPRFEGMQARTNIEGVGEATTSPRYIGDICIRCGAWAKDLAEAARIASA